jgi:hypothetical protein
MTPTPPKRTVPSSPGEPAADGASVVDQAQNAVGPVLDQAEQAAANVTEQARQQVTSQLESQKDRAIDSLVTVAQALRQTGQHLHEQQQGAVAAYLEQTAQRVEGLTNHLRARDVPRLLADVEDLARRRPGMFLGAAVGIGFFGARFLMSSGQRARTQRAPNAYTGVAAATPHDARPGGNSIRSSFGEPGADHDSFDAGTRSSSSEAGESVTSALVR